MTWENLLVRENLKFMYKSVCWVTKKMMEHDIHCLPGFCVNGVVVYYCYSFDGYQGTKHSRF